MNREFMEFLKNYGVIGLAIAVVIGGKLNGLVTAFVEGLLMPLVTFFIPGGEWREATLALGPVEVGWGLILGASIDFLIVAYLIYWFSKRVLKEETVKKK